MSLAYYVCVSGIVNILNIIGHMIMHDELVLDPLHKRAWTKLKSLICNLRSIIVCRD